MSAGGKAKTYQLYEVTVGGVSDLIWAMRARDAKMSAWRSYCDAVKRISPHEVRVKRCHNPAWSPWYASQYKTRKERAKEEKV